MEEPRHSSLGRLSFWLGLVSILAMLTPLIPFGTARSVFFGVGLNLGSFLLIAIAAFVLGVVDLVRRGGDKRFAIVGVSLSSATLAVFVVYMIYFCVPT